MIWIGREARGAKIATQITAKVTCSDGSRL